MRSPTDEVVLSGNSNVDKLIQQLVNGSKEATSGSSVTGGTAILSVLYMEWYLRLAMWKGGLG